MAKNFETAKKVEGLLNRLANYMAGEIPTNDDLNDLFGNKKDADEAPTFDDATTAYTKDEPLTRFKASKEPLISIARLRSPPLTI